VVRSVHSLSLRWARGPQHFIIRAPGNVIRTTQGASAILWLITRSSRCPTLGVYGTWLAGNINVLYGYSNGVSYLY
jgi:hypothetical protein